MLKGILGMLIKLFIG